MKRIVVTLALLFTSLAASAEEPGAALYRQKACTTCHAADGSGKTPVGKSLKVRDLRSEDVQKQSDDELAAVIAAGRDKMPAYQGSLSAEQIRQIVAHIRSLKS